MKSGAARIEEQAPRATPGQETDRRPSAEDIAWVGILPVTVALIAAILWLAPRLSGLVPDPNLQYFPEWGTIDIFKPEPVETMRVFFALLAPPALAVAVLCGSARPPNRRFDTAVIAAQLAGVALIVVAAVEQVDGPLPPLIPDAPGYFNTLLLGIPVLLGGAVIGSALGLLLLAKGRSFAPLELFRRASPGWKLGALAAALLLTALWLVPAIVTDSNVSASGLIPSEHIPNQSEDYFAVVNGRTPLVDYAPQYSGLIPLLSAPIFEAFGLSLTTFSILVTCFSLISLLAVFGVFYLITERPLPALALYLPFLALSLIPWAHHGLVLEYNANYYGFFPGRYLGPLVVAFLCALALRRPKVPAWLPFLAGGLAVMNNAEFGIPSLLALSVAMILGSDRPGGLLGAVRGLLPGALAGLAGAVALVCALTLARTGELPDPFLLTYYSRLFGRESFGLEPMPTLGLHIPMYLTFAAALLAAAVRYVQARHDRALTALLAYSGILGLLGSVYFAGRSLPWQLMLLFPLWGLALALLAWTAALYLISASGKESLSRTVLPSITAMAGFGVMIAAIVTFPLPWQQADRLSQDGPTVNDASATQRFVERWTAPGEAIVLYGTPIDHRLAERAQVEDVSPWNGVLTLLSAAEVQRSVDALEEAGGSKFFERRDPGVSLLGDQGSVNKLLRAEGFRQVAGSPNSRLALFQRP